ncbi:hypothetical protein D9M72_468900 [compost metagenome]
MADGIHRIGGSGNVKHAVILMPDPGPPGTQPVSQVCHEGIGPQRLLARRGAGRGRTQVSVAGNLAVEQFIEVEGAVAEAADVQVFGFKATEHMQRTPGTGHGQRKLRPAAFGGQRPEVV